MASVDLIVADMTDLYEGTPNETVFGLGPANAGDPARDCGFLTYVLPEVGAFNADPVHDTYGGSVYMARVIALAPWFQFYPAVGHVDNGTWWLSLYNTKFQVKSRATGQWTMVAGYPTDDFQPAIYFSNTSHPPAVTHYNYDGQGHNAITLPTETDGSWVAHNGVGGGLPIVNNNDVLSYVLETTFRFVPRTGMEGSFDPSAAKILMNCGVDCYTQGPAGQNPVAQAGNASTARLVKATEVTVRICMFRDAGGLIVVYTPLDSAFSAFPMTEAVLRAAPPIGYDGSAAPAPTPAPAPAPAPAPMYGTPAYAQRWWAPKHHWLSKSAPARPQMTTTSLTSATAGTGGSQSVAATGPGAVTFSATGLPAGASLGADGLLSWGTGLVPAVYSVTITPTSTQTGVGDPVVYQWTVLPAGTLNDPGAWAPHLRRRLA